MAVRRKKSAGGDFMLIDALKDLCAEKEISQDTLFDAIESALIFACKKTANADKRVVVDLDRDKGTFHVYEIYDVVEEVANRNREISLADAKMADPKYEVGDVFRREIPPNNFGRIAAQAAKQFVMQKIREAERGVVYDEFTNRDNDVVTGTVTRIEDGNVIVDIGKTEAILVPVEQIFKDRFQVGDRVRAYVAEVRKVGKGPQVYLSRTHPGLLRRLFELEVPEIQEGIVTIKAVARESGTRSKIAVASSDANVDPVGACLGEHGVRAQAISKELCDERIDVVKWDADPALFIANALSPSKVMRVAVSEYDKVSHVVVPNNQLSLAIGKEGQNARLAAKITGWKIDIKSKFQAKGEVLSDDLRVVNLIEEKPKKKKKAEKPKKEKPAPPPPVEVLPPEPDLPEIDDFSMPDFTDEFSAPGFAAQDEMSVSDFGGGDEFSLPDFGNEEDFSLASFDDDEPAPAKKPAAETSSDPFSELPDFDDEEEFSALPADDDEETAPAEEKPAPAKKSAAETSSEPFSELPDFDDEEPAPAKKSAAETSSEPFSELPDFDDEEPAPAKKSAAETSSKPFSELPDFDDDEPAPVKKPAPETASDPFSELPDFDDDEPAPKKA